MREYLLERVRPHYGEPHRHYHALWHIYSLLGQLDQLHRADHGDTFSLRDIIALETAIIYHDVIYDPTRTTNEEDSARLMAEHLTGVLDADVVSQIYKMILATTHRTPPSGVDNSVTGYLLDFDLQQLSSEWAWFDQNSNYIRKEYSHVSDLDWIRGRKGFFETMAKWPHIYHTSLYQSRYDDAAKANIARCIAELTQKEQALAP